MEASGQERDSLFRDLSTGVGKQMYTFCFGVRNSRLELSDSLLNNPLWGNNSVRLGPYSEIELVR